MEDLVGFLMGGVVIIAIIWGILVVVYSIFVIASLYIILVGDIIFGSIPGVSQPFSWGITGFLAGALLYFAVLEAPKLNRPIVARVLVRVVIASVVIMSIVHAS